MSLTSHLKTTNNPIRQFFLKEFPNTRTFLASARKQVRQAKIIRQARDVPRDIVGMALDYRIRYYFAVTAPKELVAYEGARQLTDFQPLSTSSVQLGHKWTGDMNDTITIFDTHTGKTVYNYIPTMNGGWGSPGVGHAIISEAMELGSKAASGELDSSGGSELPLKSEYHDFFESLNKLTTENPPMRTKLAQAEEDALNRHCIVLALMEQVVRFPSTTDNILSASEFDNKPLASIAEPHWIDDLRELSYCFYDNFNHLVSLPYTLNPSFDGSMDIGGADADMIVDGTLIDIKTTVKQEIKPDWLRQILGYVLLDYSDSYRINSIGLYMSRQGILCQWDLQEAVQDLGPGKPQTIDALRDRFRELLGSTSSLKASR